jgi:predicted RNase H-like HicB family nuclease
MKINAELAEYIVRAMDKAVYKKLEDGFWWGEIPACPGTNAYQPSRAACETELREVLEGWLIVGLEDGDDLPIIDGHAIHNTIHV